MSLNIHTNYYQDNLENITCSDCDRNFIVGEDLSRDIDISCPYCKSDNVQINAYSDEEKLEDMQMGCLGIYYYKNDEEIEDLSVEDNKIYCDECNEIMAEGYMINDGLEHYCSDKCLHENISKEDYEEIYEMGFALWTTFYE